MKLPTELAVVVRRLGELAEETVFVGGMIRQLLVTDPAAGPARPTRDVDCVVNVESRAGYEALSKKLRPLGFSECSDPDAPICRWVVDHVRVDIMPTDPSVFGFSNVWYPSGIKHALDLVDAGTTLRIIDAVHFCATKLESWLARGEGDLHHHDLEDVVAIVDSRVELFGEINAAPEDVRSFVVATIAGLLAEESFREALPGHLAGDEASQARLPVLLTRLEQVAALAATARLSSDEIQALPVAPWPAGTTHWPQKTTPLVLPPHVALTSSNLTAASYDAVRSVLSIEFHGGRLYEYDGVPGTVYAGLLSAASQGRYFHQWIRNRYGTRRIR